MTCELHYHDSMVLYYKISLMTTLTSLAIVAAIQKVVFQTSVPYRNIRSGLFS